MQQSGESSTACSSSSLGRVGRGGQDPQEPSCLDRVHINIALRLYDDAEQSANDENAASDLDGVLEFGAE